MINKPKKDAFEKALKRTPLHELLMIEAFLRDIPNDRFDLELVVFNIQQERYRRQEELINTT